MSTKVLIIVLVSVILVLGAMGGGFFLMWSKMSSTIAQVQMQNSEEQNKEDAKAEEEAAMGPTYKMDTMIVNLADQGGKRYLRITMEFELSGPEVLEEINKRMPQLRDHILMVLPSKQYSEISTTAGKIALRDELMSGINGLLKKGTVTNIYFTEFVVQ